jgi:violaxanthin de-epoxidase
MNGQRLILCFLVRPTIRGKAYPYLRLRLRNDRRQHSCLRLHMSNEDTLICNRTLHSHAPPSVIQLPTGLSLINLILPFLLALIVWTWILPRQSAAFALPSASQETVTSPLTGMACVANSCSTELKECLADPTCTKGLTCFVRCVVNSKQEHAGEGVCQQRCMDLYENTLLKRFTECSITENKCYPALPADIRYPAFDSSNRLALWQPDLIESPSKLQQLLRGRWYISAGLNPAFDCFQCQAHDFYPPSTKAAPPNNAGENRIIAVVADATFSYRVQQEDGLYRATAGDKRLALETTADADSGNSASPHLRFDPSKRWGIDSFVSSDSNDITTTASTTAGRRLVLTLRPSLMDYRDEWVVLASVPDRFFIVAYSGSNAAWEGYGGLNVYTRSCDVDAELVPAIEKGLAKVGLSLNDLTVIDNNCSP